VTTLTSIGGLRVERVLGEGGMGRVLLCRDEALQRDVAVKTLLPELLRDDAMRARFLREARALARLKSPNVVAVFAVGDDPAAGPYVVMELLDGEDVLALLRRSERLDVAVAVRIACDALTGLAAAHEAGLLHRDVKPANLFQKTDGVVVLTDFGLAKEMAPKDVVVAAPGSTPGVPAAQLAQLGVVVGTPAYLAPELARGQPPSVASDLYALGATLFHLVAGRPPFEGDAPLDVMSKAVLEPAPRLSSLRPGVAAAVDDVVAALLLKDPRDRPADALSVRGLLSHAAPAPAQATQTLGTLSGPPGADETPTSSLTPLVSSPSSATVTPMSAALSTPFEQSSPGSRGSNVKSASLTVMMTDIAGYTERTSRQSREEAARWLSLHDSLLQPCFRAFSGKVVKTIGDAFLVTFTSPTDAVHCGMAVQDRLYAHNLACSPEDRIDVRVALSAGEVRLRGILGMGGDIFGEPVNLAARLEGLAKPGEVLFTDAVFSTMNNAEVKTEPRGTHTFKGISRDVAVYAVVLDVADGSGPPFSRRTLSRVNQGSLSAAMGHARPVAARLAEAVQGIPKAVAAVAVAVVVGLLIALLSGDGRRGRIDKEAKAVREEIEKIEESKRSDDDVAVYALALHKEGARKQAWKAVQKRGLDDDDVLALALLDFAEKDDLGAVEVVAAWKDDQTAPLRQLLSSSEWSTRHHALAALEIKKAAVDDDRMAVGLLDLEAADCSGRKYGLGLLKKSGRGTRALSAVKALGGVSAGNLCLAFDVGATEDAIRRRTNDK
jgi:serine/threonine-protein kinase